MRSRIAAGLALLLLATLPGCSIRKLAVGALGNALAEGNSVYARDDDPELIEQATPFGLKTIEALLEELPEHRGLLFAAVSGFTQYGYGFVEQQADFAEDDDLARATALRDRSRRLYLRALRYGLRGLEAASSPGIETRLRRDPVEALRRFGRRDVGLLYWTAAAWGAAISISKDQAELTADQHLAEALARRALEIDESYELGSIHDFFISYEGGRQSVGGSIEEARRHFDRAVKLSRGLRAWPYVTCAETVSVANQDRREFLGLLEKALAVDPDAAPDYRLTNIIAQRRARWLRDRVDALFIE